MKEGALEYYGTVHEVLSNSEEVLKTGVNCPRVVSLYNEFVQQKMIDISKTKVCINVEEAVSVVENIIEKKTSRKAAVTSTDKTTTTKKREGND